MARQRLVLWTLVLLGAVAAVATLWPTIERLVTPGPLSQAHARLEGRCEACHLAFTPLAQDRLCSSCHRDVARDIKGKTGFHGRSDAVRKTQCRDCHSEHKGRQFDLVDLGRGRFDHQQSDFPLLGQHRGVACASCHAANTPFRQAPNECIACHLKDDVHKGRFSSKCASCHNADGWRIIRNFDHDLTGFSLLGRHQQVRCNGCHIEGKFAGTPRTCIGCHAKDDVHQGRFGTQCQTCHNSISWSAVRFDHSLTRFPLVGRHATATCSACHGARNEKSRPPLTCVGCHAKDDVHHGRFGSDCAQCHRPQGWKFATFNHDLTRFPLTGAHAGASCAACHGRRQEVAKPPLQCSGCHAKNDVHRGALGSDCAGCHDDKRWTNVAKFDHGKTAFALTGAHRRVSCSSCHRDLRFTAAGKSCASCHADTVHKGAFGRPANCASCHRTTSWKGAFFDHAATGFPLAGKHAQASCAACHGKGQPSKLSRTCVSCHRADDVHEGRFGENCGACHYSAKSFKLVHLPKAAGRQPSSSGGPE